MKKLIQTSIDLLHKSIIFIFDSGAILFCFWMKYRIWNSSYFSFTFHKSSFDIIQVLFYVLIIDAALVWGRTYKIQSSVSHVVQLKEIIKFTLIGFGIALLASLFTKYTFFQRYQTFFTIMILVPCIVIERVIVDKIWTYLFANKLLRKSVIIYGAGDTGKRLAKSIENHPKLGYQALGFYDDNKEDNSVIMANPLPVLGGREEFAFFLQKQRDQIDEVLIAMPAASTEQNMHIMALCQEYGVPYKFVPSLNDLMLHRVHQEQLDGIPLFSTKEIGISLVNLILKRLMDIVVSAIILILAAPLIGFIAVWIKRDSKGRIIFKQKRIGFKGKEFMMYKFRTMFEDTPPYAWHPKKCDDPRITRSGRFLRKTSFDELPQFWNVLRGEMSIVGPRPEMPFIVETYTKFHRERLNAKPGITGLWQISGDRSLPIHENIDHDLYYIANQSLLLDIVIVLQTVWFALIRGVGAR